MSYTYRLPALPVHSDCKKDLALPYDLSPKSSRSKMRSLNYLKYETYVSKARVQRPKLLLHLFCPPDDSGQACRCRATGVINHVLRSLWRVRAVHHGKIKYFRDTFVLCIHCTVL